MRDGVYERGTNTNLHYNNYWRRVRWRRIKTSAHIFQTYII